MTPAEKLAAEMLKRFGVTKEETVDQWLDLDYPPLNEILTGDPDRGLAQGRIYEIYGPSGAGKTYLATAAMIAAQQAGGAAVLLNHERAFEEKLAKGNGLNLQRPFFLHLKPETWEQSNTDALEFAEMIRAAKLIPPNAPIVAVFDSVAAMIPKSMLYDSKGKRRGIGDLNMNDTTALSRVSSTTLKIVNNKVHELGITCIYLNQIRTKIGVMYGDPTTTPGGAAFEFYASGRLALGRELEKDKVTKEVTGQIINFKTSKNRFARPFQKVSLNLDFPKEGGAVFDKVTSLLEHIKTHPAPGLPYSQPYFTWEDGKKYHLSVLADKIKADGTYGRLKEIYKAAPRGAIAVEEPDDAMKVALERMAQMAGDVEETEEAA